VSREPLKVSQTAYKQLQPTVFEDLFVLGQGELFAKSRSIPELSKRRAEKRSAFRR
jgi:hypothetical protein